MVGYNHHHDVSRDTSLCHSKTSDWNSQSKWHYRGTIDWWHEIVQSNKLNQIAVSSEFEEKFFWKCCKCRAVPICANNVVSARVALYDEWSMLFFCVYPFNTAMARQFHHYSPGMIRSLSDMTSEWPQNLDTLYLSWREIPRTHCQGIGETCGVFQWLEKAWRKGSIRRHSMNLTVSVRLDHRPFH